MADRRTVPVIGLVGGVSSGKSSIARWLAARRKVVIADGDTFGHQALKDPQVKEQIRRRFGDSVFNPEGDVIRAALGRKVFGSTTDCVTARNDLEKLVHPRIRDAFVGTIAKARASNDVEAVILDAAVLLEAGWNELCDVVVFVETPYPQRLERASSSRGWSEERFTNREASQLALDEKRAASDHVITNLGPVEIAGTRLEQILEQIIHQTR